MDRNGTLKPSLWFDFKSFEFVGHFISSSGGKNFWNLKFKIGIYAEVEYLKVGLGRPGNAQLVVDYIFNLLLNKEVKYGKMFTIFQVFFIAI